MASVDFAKRTPHKEAGVDPYPDIKYKTDNVLAMLEGKSHPEISQVQSGAQMMQTWEDAFNTLDLNEEEVALYNNLTSTAAQPARKKLLDTMYKQADELVGFTQDDVVERYEVETTQNIILDAIQSDPGRAMEMLLDSIPKGGDPEARKAAR